MTYNQADIIPDFLFVAPCNIELAYKLSGESSTIEAVGLISIQAICIVTDLVDERENAERCNGFCHVYKDQNAELHFGKWSLLRQCLDLRA